MLKRHSSKIFLICNAPLIITHVSGTFPFVIFSSLNPLVMHMMFHR